MIDKAASIKNQRFPLTEFMVALVRMTPAQRARASADRAAERYGLPVGWCRHYINHWRTVQ